MKNSDMKVIAIILSIALFFTIVTSNAVSIASVVFLAKGQTAAEGTVGGDASTNTDANANNNANTNTNTNTNTNSTVTPETTAPAADSNANADANANANADANANANADANKPADDANKPAGNANADKPAATSKIDKEALALYQKAAKEINTKGNASYNKKVWQSIVNFNLGNLPGFIQDLILEAVKGAMKTEDQAEDKLYEKGDASKGHMALSNCTEATVESVSQTKSGSDTVVTIVMKDDPSPSRENKDGVNAMVTGDILYIADVYETVEGGALGKVIKLDKAKSGITYKYFTIKAVIDANGHFKSIDMKGEGHIAANINGSIDATGQLDFFVRYTNFKY